MLNLLFFGNLQDLIGSSSKKLESGSLADVNELNKCLQAEYPKLARQEYKVAVNQKIAEPTQKLSDGDEVAFLPPFAGG